MHKVIIFGNSGSGKSTLAKYYVKKSALAHLDLDHVAWKKEAQPTREDTSVSKTLMDDFMHKHENWVIEGCYSDLISLIADQSTQLIFLNPGLESCLENCKKRPFEAHKYRTKEEQDANLEMLLTWVEDYYKRDDESSLEAHQKLFQAFKGEKVQYRSLDGYSNE